ncbi:Spc98 family-domain-containing protein [Emericellopsis atlantica]|uniref:Spindle pole body component n=1 Tax=Emericellopsis atlantica TaxID=2614577 RepID=A0A9P7ZNB3_9HYPO|nr:Spc98 family-domain-containing protein [Emericellopsis atlantica]KAG9255279.1 Spc98 family-domain-containing protein [Emericellopsis atlantica]
MAFAAKLGSLTDELVNSILADSNVGSSRTKKLRDTAFHTLKSNAYLRTNQFEVEHSLVGLDERFRVNDRDGLADELKQRRTALEAAPQKWHPEILALLLELSDQPTYKSKLSDLYALESYQPPGPETIDWKQIAKEDGWDEDPDLWKTNRYELSSDDDLSSQDGNDTEITSESEDATTVGRTAEHLIVPPGDDAKYDSILKAQEWRNPKGTGSGADKTAVVETQVLREILHLLQGLQTTMFDEKCRPRPEFQTSHLVWETHKTIMADFSESSRRIMVLRLFTRSKETATHVQAFQDCVARRLMDFDQHLSGIHEKLIAPNGEVVASLLSLEADLEGWLEPLFALSSILVRVWDQASNPFAYIEWLYEETSVAQLSGMTRTYEFLARIFIECFNVYLRPVRLWMDDGKLLPNDQIFFVSKISEAMAPGDIWSKVYHFRAKDGKLHAPSFLSPAANKIMNAGKNLVILGKLGQQAAVSKTEEPSLDIATVCPSGLDLVSFSDLFATAFDRWIQSKYRATSATLKATLFEKCDLPGALVALQRLYLMSDGTAAASFCEALFQRMDSKEPRWHNGSAVTAIAHEAYDHLVDTDRVTIAVDTAQIQLGSDSVRAALPHVHVRYRLPWAIQMVISPYSITQYDTIHGLLLQLRRTAYILQQPKILDAYWTDHENWDERALYYTCRHRLLWFTGVTQMYLSTLVLAPNVSQLKTDLASAEDVDGLIAVHDSFVKKVVDEACLGSRLTPIRECMLETLDLATSLQASSEQQLGVLQDVRGKFDENIRFITSGLRSVARAKSSEQSSKWDTLASMLQSGIP